MPYYVDGKTVRIRTVLLIMAIIHYTFYLTCLVLSLTDIHKLGKFFFRTELTSFVYTVQGVSSIISITVVIILCLSRRRYFLRALRQLREVDDKLQSLSLRLEYTCVSKLTVKLFVTLIVYLVFNHGINIILFEPIRYSSFTVHVMNILPNAYIWMNVIVYVTLVYLIKISLKEINKVGWNFGSTLTMSFIIGPQRPENNPHD